MIQLTRPLVVFDTETTGCYPNTVDRIVQIGLVKYWPDGRMEKYQNYVNPEIPIPLEVIPIHGITDEMVRIAPTFKVQAPALETMFRNSDYAGYSVKFDLDFMRAEFRRALGRDPLDGRSLDVAQIVQRYHRRTLVAMVKHYLGKDLEGAHDAMVDAEATADLLNAMSHEHPDLPQSFQALCDDFHSPQDPSHVDPDGKLYWRHGEACLNFSDQAGKRLKDIDHSYLQWMLKKDFPEPFKAIVREALEGRYPKP